jgi:hypothetical protein
VLATGATAKDRILTEIAERLFWWIPPQDALEDQARFGDPAGNSSTGFRYDAASGNYVFNWSTKGLATGTYTLFIDLDDGTPRELTLKLGK